MKHFAPLMLVGWMMSLACASVAIAQPAAPAAAAPAPSATDEQWYVLLNGEDRIGYMHATESIADNGDIASGQSVKIVMARAGTRIEIEVASTFLESAQGTPISATSTLNMGGVPIQTTAEFGEKAIKVTSGQRGRMTTTMKKPIEGDWLPPAAMGRYVEAQLAAGAQEIRTRTVDISSGLTPVEMTMKVRGREDIEVYGKVVPAIAWDATVSAMPGITLREYVNEQGESIKSTIALMPGLELTVLQADKDLALSELTPAEMMAQTFIVPSRKIERPRELKGAIYRLRQPNPGEAAINVPGLPSQYVGSDGNEAVLQIVYDPKYFRAGMPRRMFAPADERHLAASPILNYEDPAVKAWLEPLQRVRLAGGQAAIAEFLRQEVHQNIQTKDLSVGFATASDVARTKQGDCTEHAVLLAALLRGAGIPSRCVSGLVYADQFAGHEGIFGYHMWTQAWIESGSEKEDAGGVGFGKSSGGGVEASGGRWVDFDATLPDGVRFDATHIALSVSDLNDGAMGNDMATLIPLLGNLEIEVVQTVYDDDLP